MKHNLWIMMREVGSGGEMAGTEGRESLVGGLTADMMPGTGLKCP